MSGRKATERDRRRRALGQNFLVDRDLIRRFVASLDLRSGELVVDLGAGTGALTMPLLDTGVEVWAVEHDPNWARQLRSRVGASEASERVRVIETDVRRLRLPREPFRVVANPPFSMTTEILELLLDRPDRGPARVDLILQRDVAVKHSRRPPGSLRTAAWAPWWEFELGLAVPRSSFRPRPSVDAAVLKVTRREPAVLPSRLAPQFRELLRPGWSD